MTILTVDDKPDYFPDIELDGAELKRLITMVNTICEGVSGAQRSLSLSQYVEKLPVNDTYETVYLSYFPIAETPALILEGRHGNQRRNRDRRRRRFQSTGVSEWQPLTAESYILDGDGTLNLNISTFDFSQDRNINGLNEIRATYTAGFDFSDNEDPTVQTLKNLAADILAAMGCGNVDAVTGQYLTTEELTKVSQVEISAPASNAKGNGIFGFQGVNPALLAEFAKYRARSRHHY